MKVLIGDGGRFEVGQEKTAVVIGAGPYGLSSAAHIKSKGIQTLVFGKPMEFWQNMPSAMYLKSSWSALNISDRAGKYSLNRYAKSSGITKQEPVPLQTFLKYGHWFQQHVVPEVDQSYVQLLAQDGNAFHLDLADGRSIKASAVIVATGISSFAYIPEFASHLALTRVSHNQAHKDFSHFGQKKVIVVGSGQSALESAALLYEANAAVEIISRGPINWIDRRLYRYTGPAKRIFYPPSDVGPPGVNWLVAFPLLFRRFSEEARRSLDERAVRPAGAPWLRSRVEGRVTCTENTSIIAAAEQGPAVHLTLSDGTCRDVDHVVMGTGYRANMHSLKFIDPSLLIKIREHNGSPQLNGWFESSVPQFYFAGALAGYAFGPLCRFVVGAKVASHQIARHLERELQNR
jgi:FAD-dependent urate hydroxylase